MSDACARPAPPLPASTDVRPHSHTSDLVSAYAGPLYDQVAGILRQKIFTLEWEPTKPIPNEQQLAATMSVSVGTVRKALAMLEEERLVRRIRGKGTFVVDAYDDGEMDRFCSLYVGTRKLRPYQSSISFTTGPATGEEADKLELDLGCPVHRITRMMIEPKCALIHEQIAASTALLPDLPSLIDRSYRFLFPIYARHFDIFVNQTVESARPVHLNPEIAAALRLQADPVALRLDRIAIAIGIGPVEWAVQYIHLLDAEFKVVCK